LAGNVAEKFGKGIDVAAGRCGIKNISEQANGLRTLTPTQLNGVTECR
jgi:hypothetical protein